MYSRSLILLAIAVTVALLAGCGPSVRWGRVTFINDSGQTGNRGAAARETRSIPAEYTWRGGAHITGVSLHEAPEGFLLTGRIKAETPSVLAPSRLVRIEAVSEDLEVLWSSVAPIHREHKAGWHRGRSGTFKATVPDTEGVDHFHIGIVSRNDQEMTLPGT